MNEKWERLKKYLCNLNGDVSAKHFAADFFARFVIAWTLISRIPLPGKWWPKQEVSGNRAAAALPLAGALLGFLNAAFFLTLLGLGIGRLSAAWLCAAFYAACGWTLHLDGWGDLWDGIGSGKSGEDMRLVMKDSRLGASGAVGLILAMGTWTSLVSIIPAETIGAACVLSAAIGRLSACAAAFFGVCPWEEGMSKGVVDTFDEYDFFFAASCAFPLLLLAPKSWLFSVIIAVSTGYGIARKMNSRLGGVNGDVLGAAAVAAEILILAVFAVCQTISNPN